MNSKNDLRPEKIIYFSNNSQETIDALQLILEYKYRSRKVVFTKDLFQR